MRDIFKNETEPLKYWKWASVAHKHKVVHPGFSRYNEGQIFQHTWTWFVLVAKWVKKCLLIWYMAIISSWTGTICTHIGIYFLFFYYSVTFFYFFIFNLVSVVHHFLFYGYDSLCHALDLLSHRQYFFFYSHYSLCCIHQSNSCAMLWISCHSPIIQPLPIVILKLSSHPFNFLCLATV